MMHRIINIKKKERERLFLLQYIFTGYAVVNFSKSVLFLKILLYMMQLLFNTQVHSSHAVLHESLGLVESNLHVNTNPLRSY